MAKTEQPLSSLEAKFCERIVAGENGTSAAKSAGYAEGSAAVTASKLLKKTKIRNEISRLRRTAVAGVILPGAEQVILSREFILQRLVEVQHGYRDATALKALELLGAEEFQMFASRMVLTDPAAQSTDDLQRVRDKIRKKHGLGA